MLLWVILTFMVALGVAGLTFALVRPRDRDRAGTTTTSILAAQLADVDSQLAAGEVSQGEAAPLKTEIRRRILSEAREPQTIGKPVSARALPYFAFGVAGVVALAATSLYALLGRPDLSAGTHVQARSAPEPASRQHPG